MLILQSREIVFNNTSINYNFDFPKLKYDYELFVSWEKTKYLPIMPLHVIIVK